MERGSDAYLAALAKRIIMLNDGRVWTVGDLRSVEIWKELHSKSTVIHRPPGGGDGNHTIIAPLLLTLTDADVEVLALSMEKDAMMAVIGGAAALMSQMLHDSLEGGGEGSQPAPADKSAKDAVEALRPGSAAGGRNPAELLREVPLWDELYRARVSWQFATGELSALSRVLTAREAMKVIQAVQSNIAELGQHTYDEKVVSTLF